MSPGPGRPGFPLGEPGKRVTSSAMRFIAARIPGLLLLAALAGRTPAADPAPTSSLPLLLERHFDTPASLRELVFSDPAAWRHAARGDGFSLELARQSQYQPPFRSPVNLALLPEVVGPEFVLQADLLQTGREYGHRDMCVVFGFQDPAHYYYIHLASAADDHAHNVFIVNGAARTRIARRTSTGVDWGTNRWHTVRVERRSNPASLRVFFDDPAAPIMEAADNTFGAGFIGFGSFDDTGLIDNLRVWSSPAEPRPAPAFPRSVPH